MKKTVFSLMGAAVAAIAFTACSNDKAATEEQTTEETPAVEYNAELVDVEKSTVDTLPDGTVQVENEVQVTPEEVAQ